MGAFWPAPGLEHTGAAGQTDLLKLFDGPPTFEQCTIDLNPEPLALSVNPPEQVTELRR